MCEMPEAQTANYETMMEREVAKAKWTDQQLVSSTNCTLRL
jgi:hypothetical protein